MTGTARPTGRTCAGRAPATAVQCHLLPALFRRLNRNRWRRERARGITDSTSNVAPQALLDDVELGCRYATFQIFLPPRHMNTGTHSSAATAAAAAAAASISVRLDPTGGEYRNDEQYLTLCAQRIEKLQNLCWEVGLNCYVETHIDRLS